MNRSGRGSSCKHHELFRLRFQRRLGRAAARNIPVAEVFGRVWEQTISEVPLNDRDQTTVYWQLLDWARSGELFTDPLEILFLQRRPLSVCDV